MIRKYKGFMTKLEPVTGRVAGGASVTTPKMDKWGARAVNKPWAGLAAVGRMSQAWPDESYAARKRFSGWPPARKTSEEV